MAKEWDAGLYESGFQFVWKSGAGVLSLLDAKPGEAILDLGCGTGHLTAQIAATGATVLGIDASPAMVEQARQNFPKLSFQLVDATQFQTAQRFDAVFSNAALHWIHDADGVIKSVYKALKSGGRFVGEFGGKDNNKLMMAAAEKVLRKHGYLNGDLILPWYFPSVAEYATRLEAGGFRVTFATHFDRQTLLQDGRDGMAKWFSMFGESIFKAVPAAELPQILNEITGLLQPTNEIDGEWYADYKRLRFIVVKEL